MWPWGHLAVGYLAYTGVRRLSGKQQASGLAVLLVAFGTQFPDLIDKPLAWTLPLLPSGRSLGHSLLIGIIMIGVIWLYARKAGHSELAVAFGFGYLSHSIVDAAPGLVLGQYADLAFLAWPVLAVGPDENPAFILHFTMIELTPYFVFQLVLIVLAFGLWLREGKPGLATIRAWVQPNREQLPD